MTDAPEQPLERRLVLDEPFAGIELGYLEWLPADPVRTVVCVHGLTRNAHDFDVLARELARHGARVLSVDVVGRGRSSWLEDPHGYAVPTYVGQLSQWLAGLELDAVDWIGTSMGGLIGMAMAAGEASPIQRLILNDIGPFVSRQALLQIKSYLALELRFATLEEAENHLRFIHAPFGHLTDEQWRHLTCHSVVADGDRWRLHYDPGIKVPYAELAEEDIALWELWDRIRCPTFVLHGWDSVILSGKTCDEMRRRGPQAEVAHFFGVGHAPALMSPDQILTVRRWLHL